MNNSNMENLTIRRLTNDEILSIYNRFLVIHFPSNEVKPLSAVQRMLSKGIYAGYGMYGGASADFLLCYAFFTILPDQLNILLDYFAVVEDYRSLGTGSLFLKKMKETISDYDGLLIESEDPAFATNTADHTIREKRISFYHRNGAVETGILAEVFGVHYRLLYVPIKGLPSVQTLFTDLDAIYQHMVSRKHYDHDIHFYIDSDSI